MHEFGSLLLVFTAGGLLGAFFFGGLWWTVRIGISSNRPALWFCASLLLRTGVTLVVFFLVARGQAIRFVACLVGFVTARQVVTWLVRPSQANRRGPSAEASHAAQC